MPKIENLMIRALPKKQMRIIRKTNILVKTRHLLAVHTEQPAEPIFCPQCGEAMSDVESAAQILQTSVRELYRHIEAGRIHFFETEEKTCFLCPKSFDQGAEMNSFQKKR